MNNIELNNLKEILLGLYLDEAKNILDNMNLDYKIIKTVGIKDLNILKDERVVNINLKENTVFITISYFHTKNI